MSAHHVRIDDHTNVTLVRRDGWVTANVTVTVDFPEIDTDTPADLADEAWWIARAVLNPPPPEYPRQPISRPTCARCGERFDAFTRKARFCSTRCRVDAHRARQ